ncbi:vitamin K-dependent gamma-carboxylase isoform X2 [Tetranychus urticae]|uniref:vitamin K-dependent gamma-carboxylase isoform X2 n=1 Tax=Tetranychus urticae TaxID=32264 RepID=UPI00077BCEB9|nr:vitamin K-dependent gamma-carboxylase isoform X2 [Tetranychus urticae]
MFKRLIKYQSSFNSFVRFMFKPVDGHGLAVFRILFGLLMLIDLQVERAFHAANERWSDPDECRFPLFHWIKPLPGHYMNLLYVLMTLDKSYWNNHTYLFGLITMMLTVSDAHKIWSLDYRTAKDENKKIPFWQYFIIRFQISLVYFLAGVKKANLEWIGGYSMRYLSNHWVFSPFRLVLSPDLVDLLVVHWGGFLVDASVGFFLLFQSTRPLGYLFTGLFNAMNSQMFSIGMFPYVMLAVLPIYSSPDWPVSLIKSLNLHVDSSDNQPNDKKRAPSKETQEEQKKFTKTNKDLRLTHSDTDGGKTMAKNEMKKAAPNLTNYQSKRLLVPSSIDNNKVTKKQQLVCLVLIIYMGLQLGLPFSHNLTQGYNTWTQGIYGYSWDMMVHNWRLLGKRILIIDKQSKREMYLNVEKYSPNNRWTHHADMAKQFAVCVGERLKKTTDLTDFEVHIDVWMSLNKRFAQRIFDPRVDLLAADWSPFKKPSWVLPMLTQFTSWRSTLKEYEEEILNSNETYVVFMADFPGLDFVNFVDPQFGNTTFKVLSGWVKLQVEGSFVRIMSRGDDCKLPSGQFHSVVPIKSEPASYMYTFTNKTAAESVWEPDAHRKENSRDVWIVRFCKKWVKSFQITLESLWIVKDIILNKIMTGFTYFTKIVENFEVK